MLESANQQHAHTTTTRASSYKSKRSDLFYGRIKRRVPLQDVGNSNKKRRVDYLKEKQRDQRSKESLEEEAKRLRKMREYAKRNRSTENESPAHRETCLNDERQRSQQRCVNESEAQREARLKITGKDLSNEPMS